MPVAIHEYTKFVYVNQNKQERSRLHEDRAMSSKAAYTCDADRSGDEGSWGTPTITVHYG